ncbi:MAG: MoxR family ATPase [bacterium]|nr:MoxR family ATPase [bacterium]
MNQRPDLQNLQASLSAVREQIATVIVGQHDMVELLLAALLAEGHVLLEGMPGVAKTLAARLLARLLDCSFARIQFTPDLMPADILGTSVFDARTLDFSFRKGPVFAHVILTDEINRAPAKTQAALFEVMEERQVSMDGVRHPLPSPFIVLATQNPIEQEGTYRLPEAQLDRFLFKVRVDYPALAEEEEILRRHHTGHGINAIDLVKPILTAENINAYRALVRQVVVEEHLLTYIARIVHATRTNAMIYLAASPRASIGMLQGAKAIAVLQGRDYVIPDDIQHVAAPVLRHRIQLIPEKELEGFTPDAMIKEIMRSIDVPR